LPTIPFVESLLLMKWWSWVCWVVLASDAHRKNSLKLLIANLE
jgi:hypothetical protein